MNVGLIDVDSHNFPNLCLMKISAYHKSKGDQVVKGGTGYDLANKLPDIIEHMYPDYDLYGGGASRAYGHLTRGCPRKCKFCIVSEKEGNTHTVADISEFWKGQKEIMLMDSNITASKECEKHFESLIKTKALINFAGGLDVRLLTDKGAAQLNEMKTSMIHFAWDNYEFDTYEKLKRIRPLLNKASRNIRVYVLTNFNTTTDQDLERIYKLKELGYDPFVMIYDKPNAPAVTKKLQRWCNNKYVFYSCERFEDYNRQC